MRDSKSSFTAAWVAACRGAADLLPRECQLVHDPYGLTFAGSPYELVARAARSAPFVASRLLPITGPLYQSMLWLQLRTAAIDQYVGAFVASGGRQLVLLGAGLDARAFRLSLGDCHVIEVDHPATQARKRSLAAIVQQPSDGAHRLTFLPWDFTRQSLGDLPLALDKAGLDTRAPTLTIWEGVTMYLTEPIIEASVAAIRGYSGQGSELVLTYFDANRIQRPDPMTRIVKAVVAGAGEPFQFGFHPAELPTWMSKRGWQIITDESDIDLLDRLMTMRFERYFARRGGHVALARLA